MIMASFLDKFKVTTALDTSTTMDLSCTHVTTSDWLQMSPVYIKEMVPGETLEVHQETFSRMAAMNVPTFGRGLIHNRAFFVPMRTVFSKWNDFITAADIATDVLGTSNSSASTQLSVSSVPTLKNSEVVKLFVGDGTGSTVYANIVTSTATSAVSKADIEVAAFTSSTTSTTAYAYYKLTAYGRRTLKILQSLGYQFVWAVGSAPSSIANLEFSGMPLLAWLRIILDWYYPTAYVGDADYLKVKSILDNVPDGSGVYSFTAYDLGLIFGSKSIFNGITNYDSDYFVSAFDNFNGNAETPNTGVYFANLDNNGEVGVSTGQYPAGTSQSSHENTAQVSLGTPYYRTSNASAVSNVGYITQMGLDALKALTDYTKRHQLVGARALDRFYARFGKSLDSAKLDRSNYIGAQNVPLQFGDVMAHADTNGAALGDYAGKGLAYGEDGNFSFSTDEYGFFVIISSIIPQIGYYQGVDRNVLHLSRTDYWTPEYDQIGNQSISKAEIYLPMNVENEVGHRTGPNHYTTADAVDGIFGYTPRYSEYKIGRDKLTGDFRYASLTTAGDVSDAWHLFRNMGETFNQGVDSIKHDKYFTQGYDWTQYNRVFNYTDATTDKFYLIHTFNVKSTAPMHSLYDTYKFENEDEGAKKVIADVNGVKVN